MEKKKTVLYHSDFALATTGFGRATKALLSYLHSTGKYEIVNLACGMRMGTPQLTRTPWKTIGTIPASQAEINQILSQVQPEQREDMFRIMSYGTYCIDKVIYDIKPDIYIGVQDFWGINYNIDKKWFKNIPSAFWTTLDSQPLLKDSINKAKDIPNYWVWSNFAEKDLHALGHKHVKTVHGPVETKWFKPLLQYDKKALRKKNNIPEDAFVTGFVFRNQLRKTVPNLLKGYQQFKQQNPKVKTRLLLHTDFMDKQGWKIETLVENFGIDPKEILTTYVCKHCRGYEVKTFHELDKAGKVKIVGKDCPHCSAKETQVTTGVNLGVSEEHLNEVYNMMDVYCHPFTSGGQEIPIQEAKLAGLVTLVTNYSCGAEMCEPEAGSIPLEWFEDYERTSSFAKSKTRPSSIAKQLLKVYKMKPEERKALGLKGRQWAIDGFSSEVIGKFVEDWIDSQPKHEFSFDKKKEESQSPQAKIPAIEDDGQWLIFMYKAILHMEVDEKDQGYKDWIAKLKDGMPRQTIEKFFRQQAAKKNAGLQNKKTLIDFLDPGDKGRRVLVVIPESIGDCFLVSSLFEDMKKRYPGYRIYVATKPENFDIFTCNKYVHRTIPYIAEMENLKWSEGAGEHYGHFEIVLLPHVGTQRHMDFSHNGLDKIGFDIHDESISSTIIPLEN
jgi:glycosyltransferase involved in cell wall biosynthesis